MSIHEREPGNTNPNLQAPTTPINTGVTMETNGTKQQVPGTGPRALNFGSSTGLINPSNLDHKVAELGKAIGKTLADNGAKADINIFSNLLVISKINGKKIYYYTIVPGTVSTELSVSQFMDMIEAKQEPLLSVDIVSNEMHRYISGELVKSYTNGQFTTRSLDGLVIPNNIDTTTQDLVNALTAKSYNTITIEASIDAGEIRDISIRQSLAQTNGMTRLKLYNLTGDSPDTFGRPTRTSWGIELTAPSSKGFRSTLTQEEVVTSTKGFINIVPKQYEIPYAPNMPPVKKVGFVANIIINMIDQPTPTLGYALMAIASASVLTRGDNWVKPLVANVAGIGHLNKIANINNDKQGKAIDMEGMKMKPVEKAVIIKKIVDRGVMISVDIPLLDDKITTLGALAVVGTNENQSAVQAATKDIVDTLNVMTDGGFTKEMIPGMLDGPAVILPNGEFTDREGLKSIDHIDAPYVVKNYGNGYEDLLSNLMFSELGHAGAPVLERVSFLQKAGIDAKLTGKKVRITFNAEFINALVNAFAKCGLSPVFDTNTIIPQNGLEFTAGYHNNAIFGQNTAQFGHAGHSQAGYDYNQAYRNSYYGA